ncbi:long-chain fatty acid--CoA ligase [Rhodoblastus sphagnicola]|uniref:3-methylmercaptopropionyl-CoA ligase n=1 Tax=Rhodoblastus sphagnicola TaxID=333368 RepID=A0A2S6N0B5_9HYPH|nr:long-chain fatty acid--CoA ligase [Rhodoblastus sphagnicola]MBB4198549.1 fatty-acyl-CoA synthase [Rhodoblastus sphagnicola]PPQ28067.1 long-chain fatty acid--CoA ligase [Rhodoblastus sphagnicola]
MLGLMQRRELLISSIIVHAARHHGAGEVVSRRENGALVRTTYAEVELRARKLMGILAELGVKFGDRVATLAMNSDRHLELYYAISGMGAVCHTINPRLSMDDIGYILGHAEDGLLFVDPGFLPLAVGAAAKAPGVVRAIVVLGEEAEIKPGPPPPGVRLHAYETLLAQANIAPDWPVFDENTASGLCYTSGTTGRPKGVLYSHRSSLLHAFAVALPDVVGLRATSRVLPVVPMFHVNAWGLPYAAPMTGATLLMPGRQLDPVAVLHLINVERADVAVGVPTVWNALLAHMRATGERFDTLKRVMSGGAALPRALVEGFAELGVHAFQGWGMTETSPVVTLNAPKPATADQSGAVALDHACKQGRALFGADVRVLGGDGEVPWDGRTPGEVSCAGHWIASGYFRHESEILSRDGWLPTGDVGVIDANGYLKLTDRGKDLIKSGGEWISSIELENIAVSHPDVAEAAAIAVPDDKWGERPLVIVVPRTGKTPDPEAIRAWFAGRVAKYAMPDRVAIAEELPHGATGKVLKTELRRLYLAPTE